MFKPRWFVEHLGLEYKVLPLDRVDENSQGFQAYAISTFAKSSDNKAIIIQLFSECVTEQKLVLHAKGTLGSNILGKYRVKKDKQVSLHVDNF